MKPVQLFTAGTPNGQKVSILLEELRLLDPAFKYETHAISIGKNEQKEDWYQRMNPNGKIPTILDPNNTETSQDGFAVMESMAIMLYLQRKFDSDDVFSWPDADPKSQNLHYQVLAWMAWQVGGQGPMQGQANHFRMQATGTPKNVVPYGLTRFHDETGRLYGVLEAALQGRDYLVGEGRGRYSLADMIVFPWAFWYRVAGIRHGEVGPGVKAWIERVGARPAVKAGLEVPSKSSLLENLEDPEWMPAMPEL